jgi:hypothetical protein
MKKLLFYLPVFIIFTTASAQEPLSFSKVIETPNKSKTELFIEVSDWFAVNYNSAQDVIQMSDKDAGIIIGKGAESYTFGKTMYLCYDGFINYTVKVQLKEGRYKIEINNFAHSVLPKNSAGCNMGLLTTAQEYKTEGMGKNGINKVWCDLKEKAEAISNHIFIEIEGKTNKSKPEDNW